MGACLAEDYSAAQTAGFLEAQGRRQKCPFLKSIDNVKAPIVSTLGGERRATSQETDGRGRRDRVLKVNPSVGVGATQRLESERTSSSHGAL